MVCLNPISSKTLSIRLISAAQPCFPARDSLTHTSLCAASDKPDAQGPQVLWRLVEALLGGLWAELDLTPKPGLVDRWDSGSHEDLDYSLMARSIALLELYFSDCANALLDDCSIERLRKLGILAEQRMFEQLGSNTHRGAIFLGGVLLASVHAAQSLETAAVSAAVADVAGRLFAERLPSATKGSRVRARYKAGGIVQETLNGLPAVFTVAVPALHEADQLGFGQRDSLFLALARLMQKVEDTTALRRCGPAGLAQIKCDGEDLELLLLKRIDPVPFLTETNRRYQAQCLTMGGVADLLAIGVAWKLSTSHHYEHSDFEQITQATYSANIQSRRS